MAKYRQKIYPVSIFLSLLAILLLGFAYFFSFNPLSVFAVVFFVILLTLKIEWGIYLMALFLPLINWHFYYAGLEIPFIDLLGLVVFSSFFLRAFLERDFSQIKTPFLIPFVLFFSSAVLSSIFSANPYDSLWYSLRWILFFYLIYIVLPFSVIKNKSILKKTLIFFSVSTLAVALSGLLSIFEQDWLNTLARVRPVMLFGIYPLGENQNLLVETLLPGIFVLLSLKYFTKDGLANKLINLSILFAGSILILTFSRGAWISLFIFSFLIALFYYRQKIMKFFIPLFIVLVIMIPVFVYMISLQTAYEVGVSSNQSRFLLSEIAWDAFRQNPLLGKGSGEYFYLVADNTRFRAQYGQPVESHGFLQKILAENGFLGIITFSIFVLAIFFKLSKVFKTEKYYPILLPLFAAAGSIFLFELFNTSYYKGKLWFVIALALAALNLFIRDKKYARK